MCVLVSWSLFVPALFFELVWWMRVFKMQIMYVVCRGSSSWSSCVEGSPQLETMAWFWSGTSRWILMWMFSLLNSSFLHVMWSVCMFVDFVAYVCICVFVCVCVCVLWVGMCDNFACVFLFWCEIVNACVYVNMCVHTHVCFCVGMYCDACVGTLHL